MSKGSDRFLSGRKSPLARSDLFSPFGGREQRPLHAHMFPFARVSQCECATFLFGTGEAGRRQFGVTTDETESPVAIKAPVYLVLKASPVRNRYIKPLPSFILPYN